MSIKTAQTLVSEAMQEIKTISAEEAYKIFEENNCNLIDIRDTNELEITGAIENSINIPRGLLEFQLDPNGTLTQNGITDHRINLTLHKLEEFLEGEVFDEMVENLNLQAQEEKLKNLN